MAISQECGAFISRWMHKANLIELDDLASYFDRFITLFVAYNRLYAEATFELCRAGSIKLRPHANFPDGKAAKEYVVQFLGEHELAIGFESDAATAAAVEDMKTLIADSRFNILLKGPEAKSDRRRDQQLLARLESHDASIRAKAVLEFVYSVRCNTLHGSKSFEPVQAEVLKPCITVVDRLIALLLLRLS